VTDVTEVTLKKQKYFSLKVVQSERN